ncbi:recombinase family protein [Streptomyces albus]|uniref:recombinase family protein n=1 Tax=Streptomyces sp. NRRL F-5917 TaxID=1463873 RepID=UPI001F42662C|nr:recombinase family protein [Streptomyces sp. NRRL F-5917]
MTRPRLGPWLRDEMGSYDGLVAAAVDRLGRNVVDCLNTGCKMHDEGKLLLTHGHDGPWNLDDPAGENRFTIEAWGAQMEMRSIQRRHRDVTVKARTAGRPKHQPSYGFRNVRKVMNGRVDSVELHPHAAFVIRNVAQRILGDPVNVTPSSEAARLNRIGELAPADHTDVMYGKPARHAAPARPGHHHPAPTRRPNSPVWLWRTTRHRLRLLPGGARLGRHTGHRAVAARCGDAGGVHPCGAADGSSHAAAAGGRAPGTRGLVALGGPLAGRFRVHEQVSPSPADGGKPQFHMSSPGSADCRSAACPRSRLVGHCTDALRTA